MSAGYVIAQLKVTNPENYKEYVAKVTEVVKKFGGEYLVRNGEYQDIFYTILVTNWMMGLVVLTFVPFFLKRVFRISFKKLFVF